MHAYPFEQRTLPAILADQAARMGDAPWFFFRGETVTFAQAEARASRLAGGYHALGVGKGDRVAAMMPNCPEFLYHWFALAMLGAVDTPVNTAYRGEFLRHAIAHVNARVMLIHADYLERLEAVAETLTGLETIVVYDPAADAPGGEPVVAPNRFRSVSYQETAAGSPEPLASLPLAPSDPLMVIYTSGTTGPSKGVVLSHHALYCYAADAIAMRGFTAADTLYTCLPLYHINARFLTVMVSLLNGSCFAMSKRFSASGFWEEIRRHRATVFTFLGGIPAMLLNQPPRKDDRDHAVRAAFGGPLSPEMAREMERRFGLKVYTGFYGMTEAIGVTYLDVAEMERLKQAGRWEAVLGMGREDKTRFEVKLVDDRGGEVPTGQPGEIVCRPARPFSMFTEYINMPSQTVEAFAHLWFHTGDLARRDDDGFFYFLDRKKDYLRRRGENISSFEIEKVINQHPAVFECAAIGVPSELVEDELMVVLRLRDGEALTPADLLEWCRPRMPGFMLPRYVRTLDGDFPRTPTNRIQKYQLRQEGVTADTWDREG